MNTKDLAINFEGPEKKIEIILKTPVPFLRSNENGKWERVVSASKAHILSTVSTPEMDAYLLSESSLFVWDNRILMITCGKTVLVDAVDVILEFLPLSEIEFFFYERKNLMFPGDQPSDFESDVLKLETYFPGKSYRFGPSNNDHLHLFFSSQGIAEGARDATLQILMHHVDQRLAHSFDFKNNGEPGRRSIHTLINNMIPDLIMDDHLFSPNGYSLNAISKGNYCAVHITPQSSGSYASFETNIYRRDYSDIIRQVISVFMPRKYSLVLTNTVNDKNMLTHHQLKNSFNGYEVTEKNTSEFDSGYAVSFLNNVLTAEV